MALPSVQHRCCHNVQNIAKSFGVRVEDMQLLLPGNIVPQAVICQCNKENHRVVFRTRFNSMKITPGISLKDVQAARAGDWRVANVLENPGFRLPDLSGRRGEVHILLNVSSHFPSDD